MLGAEQSHAGAQHGLRGSLGVVAHAADFDVDDRARHVAERGASPIVGVGFPQASSIEAVARDFPKLQFAIVDMVVPLLAIDASQPELVSMLTTINASLTTDVVRALLVKVGNGTNTYDTAAKAFLASLSSNG